MQSPKAIKKYVKDCFELFGLNYNAFFTSVDGRKTYSTRWEMPDGSINMSAVVHASMVLGLSKETILETDYDAAMGVVNKHPYVKYLQSFFQAYNYQTTYKKGVTPVDVLLCRIFDENDSSEKELLRYNREEIKSRLQQALLEIDSFAPGTYHEGAEIKNLDILVSNFFHFQKAPQLVSSFLDMHDSLFSLFAKALDEELSESEKNEYNFLVTQFAFSCKDYRNRLIYHDNIPIIRKMIPNISKENMRNYLSVRLAYSFEPWRCSEFINDKELVERYLEYFPNHKAEMRRFAMEATKIRCYFNWSDGRYFREGFDKSDYELELLEDGPLSKEDAIYLVDRTHRQERTKFYLDKTDEELSDDLRTSKNILAYCRPARLGGIPIKHQSQETNVHDYYFLIKNFDKVRYLKAQNYIDIASNSPYCVQVGGVDNE